MKTLKQFNAALKAAGVPSELVKGEGYFYFVQTEDGVQIPSVTVSAYSHLHPEVWAYELADAVAFYRKHRPAQIGRPAELEEGKRRNIYIDAESWARAVKLGNGNASEGIRLALAALSRAGERASK